CGRTVDPGRLLYVLGAVHHVSDVGNSNWSAVSVGNDDGLVLIAANELIVGLDGPRLGRAVEIALGLVHIGGSERGAEIFQAQPIRGQRSGVGLNANAGTLP